MQSTLSPQEGTLRAAIYDRVSRDRRKTARSVGEQNEANREAVEVHGWKLAGEYRDNDRSASRYATKDREDWLRLVADLEAGRYDVLVLWESSRGSRDPLVWFPLLETCRNQGVLIHVTSHERTYDPRISRDWKTLAEEGVSSANESNQTSDRINRTATKAARAGKPWGTCPYGYRREYSPRTGELMAQLPDTATAPIVVEIVTRVAKSDAVSRIRDDLNRRGIPSPKGKRWSTYTVRHIAMNPVYIGQRTHKGETYTATWPPITNDPGFEQDFHAAGRILRDPSRKMTSVDPAHHTARPGAVANLLSYLVECGKCGGPLAARFVKSLDHWTYNCHARPGGCVSTRKDRLEEAVVLMTLARLDRPDAHRLFVAADDAEVMAAEAEAERLTAEYETWMEEALAEGVSAGAVARYEARKLPLIEAARQRAQSARVPAALRTLMDPVGDIVDRWDALRMPGEGETHRGEYGAQRDVLRAIYQRIALDPIKVRGTGRGALDWTRVRVLPHGSEEWITFPPRAEVMPD